MMGAWGSVLLILHFSLSPVFVASARAATGSFAPETVPPSTTPSDIPPSNTSGGTGGENGGKSGTAQKKNGSCDAPCKSYQDDKAKVLLSACGPAPEDPNSSTKVENNGITYDNYNACAFDVGVRWGDLGQRCDVRNFYDSAWKWQLGAAAPYTAAAIVCTAVCVSLLTGVGAGAAAAANAACIGLGSLAVAADIAGTVYLQVENKKYQDWWNTAFADANVAAGGAAAAAIAAANVSAQISGNLVATSVGYCFAAGLLTIAAGLKWASFAENLKGRDKVCKQISDLDAILIMTQAGIGGAAPTFGGGINPGGGGLMASGGQTQGVLPSGSDPTSIIPPGDDLNSPFISAATADNFGGKLLQQMGNKNNIGGELKDLGTSLQAIAGKLATTSPGAIVAATVPNMPADLASTFQKLDQAVKDGKIQTSPIVNSAIPQASGRKLAAVNTGTKGTTTFGGLFNSNPATAGAPTATLDFPAQKPSQAPIMNEGDIWHADWKGSIFQIVSRQIVKDPERVEKLEWATPLNRALMGLPALKKNGGKK